METAVKRLYEGMFLIDSAQASDWDAVVKTIKKLLKRSDAEIVTIRNWAERKLAYEIDHKSRGTYVLCFFKADGVKIRNIEKDVQLSEQIMRVLILGTEGREKQDVERDMHGLPEVKEESRADEPAEDTTSPQKEDEQADEPEQSDEPVAADEIEPEQSDEPPAADVSEPEEPAEPVSEDMSEPERPTEPTSVDVTEPEQPAEPTSVDVTEPEQPAEPTSVDVTESEQPATPEPEASDTTETQQPEKEQEPKKPDKKRFFNW